MQPPLAVCRITNVVYSSPKTKIGGFAMSQNPEFPLPTAAMSSVTACSNCHSVMPSELRFCRNCGFRLGEGVAEYTETVRFQGGHPGLAPSSAGLPVAVCAKKRRRMSGMTWMFLALLVFFIAAAGFTAVITPLRRGVSTRIMTPLPPRSYVGVSPFDTTDGGVTFENVEAPGTPADKAGLVGGDVITSFDGQTVKTDDEMMDLLGHTPIGKTVDVVYLRDGETKTTKLTTISKEEYDRLTKAFKDRPEGKGQFGYDDGESDRVPIEGTKLFGVKLDSILTSRPGDLAGVKNGDIVIAFDGIPIRTPEEFRARVRRALPYSTIKLLVIRGTERLEIPVKMGRQ
jgi:membrane-associated protease RseP (regulator of RpoE activity)